jgi:4-aminobutyrate aminotransferase-like enzyme
MSKLAAVSKAAAPGGSIQLFYATSVARNRPTVDRADGIYMWDTAGRRYIDAPTASTCGTRRGGAISTPARGRS